MAVDDQSTGTAPATDTATELAELRRQLEVRGTIGRAQGLLMARLGIDADQALRLLEQAAQTDGTDLPTAAAEVLRGHVACSPGT